MAPTNMQGAVDKLEAAGASRVWLTERGTFFGYGDLVVDLRSLSVMAGLVNTVVLDVTHSLQRPGAAGAVTGGHREYAVSLARAGAAWGVDGLFIEAHPSPDDALSDSATMVDAETLRTMLKDALEHWRGRHDT